MTCPPRPSPTSTGSAGSAAPAATGVAITLAEPREHRLLQNIERATKRKIEISRVPTVADVRARRLDLTRAALREALIEEGDDLDHYRVVVESLADEFDVMAVALAAVKLAHQADRRRRGGRGDPRAAAPRADRRPPAPREPRGKRAGPPPPRGSRRSEGPPGGFGGGIARISVGAGRRTGVRPGDLVGAIANEAGISGRLIGAIEIADRCSFVDVPGELADEVVAALRSTTIKGKKVTVRRVD